MKLLKYDRCPDCGGRLKVNTNGISCLSCDFSKEGLTPALQKRIQEESEEVNFDIELSTAGNTLVEADFEGLIGFKRLCRNLSEGYQLKDIDKLLLLDAGFARRLTTEDDKD